MPDDPLKAAQRKVATSPWKGMDFGQWQLTPKASSTEGESPQGQDKGPVLVPFSERPVIPVIFVPGVMASNLYHTKMKKSVWQPPNVDWQGMCHTLGSLFKYLFKSAEERKEELDPDQTEVYRDGQITADAAESQDVLHERGWGTMMRTAYHPFMAKLQTVLNSAFPLFGIPGPWWQEGGLGLMDPPAASGGEPVSEQDVRDLAGFRFEVWGGGYNWLRSNVDSAIELIERLEKELPDYYSQPGRSLLARTDDGKIPILLVTHSMGGIVARAMSNLLTEGSVEGRLMQYSGSSTLEILGVAHTALPALGAPTLYVNMRRGYGGITGVFLSRDAEDFVAIAHRVQATFELLPTKKYKNGEPWLFVSPNCGQCPVMEDCPEKDKRAVQGTPANSLALPTKKGPFEDIYKRGDAFGLIPDHNLHLTEPEKRKSEFEPAELEQIRGRIDRDLDKAEAFHDALAGYYHTPTYAYWKEVGEVPAGDKADENTSEAQEDYYSYGDVVWQGPAVNPDDPASAPRDSPQQPLKDSGKGVMVHGAAPLDSYDFDRRKRWRFCASFVPGDATVDQRSGSAPKESGNVTAMNHADLAPVRKRIREEEEAKVKSYDHQDICNDKSVQWYACYCIAKLVAKNKERIHAAKE